MIKEFIKTKILTVDSCGIKTKENVNTFTLAFFLDIVKSKHKHCMAAAHIKIMTVHNMMHDYFYLNVSLSIIALLVIIIVIVEDISVVQ